MKPERLPTWHTPSLRESKEIQHIRVDSFFLPQDAEFLCQHRNINHKKPDLSNEKVPSVFPAQKSARVNLFIPLIFVQICSFPCFNVTVTLQYHDGTKLRQVTCQLYLFDFISNSFDSKQTCPIFQTA